MPNVGDMVLFYKDGWPQEYPAVVVEALPTGLTLGVHLPSGYQPEPAPTAAGARGPAGAAWRPKP